MTPRGLVCIKSSKYKPFIEFVKKNVIEVNKRASVHDKVGIYALKYNVYDTENNIFTKYIWVAEYTEQI